MKIMALERQWQESGMQSEKRLSYLVWMKYGIDLRMFIEECTDSKSQSEPEENGGNSGEGSKGWDQWHRWSNWL